MNTEVACKAYSQLLLLADQDLVTLNLEQLLQSAANSYRLLAAA
jgi:hypothetical protein